MWIKNGNCVINLDKSTGFCKGRVDNEAAIKFYTIVDGNDSWSFNFTEEEGGEATRDKMFVEIFKRMARGDEYFDSDYWLENEVIM